MTTVSLGVAAFLAFSLFNTSPSTQPVSTAQSRIEQPTSTTASITTNKSIAQATKVKHELSVMSNDEPLFANTATPTPKNDTGLLSPVDLSNLTIIQPNDSQLTALGISRDDEGAVGYWVNKNGKTLMRSFPPLSGMKFIMGSPDADHATVAQIIPSLVTNADGLKRFFIFENGSYIGGKNVAMVALNKSANGNKENDVCTVGRRDANGTNPNRDSFVTLSETRTLNSGDSSQVTQSISEEDIMTIDTDGPGEPPMPPRAPMLNSPAKFNIESIELMKGNIDSAIGALKIDSLLKSLGYSEKKMKGGQVTININSTKDLNKCFDSTGLAKLQRSLTILQTKIAGGKGIPDSNGLAIIQKQMFSELKLQVPDTLMKLVSNVLNIAKANMPDPNKLVPVMIENRMHPGKENAVIFWYAPSPKLTSVFQKELPPSETVTAVQATKAFQNLSIYPNPASANSTVSFDLSDSRTVTLALYNLLGQKLLEASKPTTQSAGHNEMKVDLSTMQAGVYILVATTDKGEQLSQRIVVEK